MGAAQGRRDTGWYLTQQACCPSLQAYGLRPRLPERYLHASILSSSHSLSKMGFWCKCLNTTLVSFSFFFLVSGQLKFIAVTTSECQVFSLCCSHEYLPSFPWPPLLAPSLQAEPTVAAVLCVPWAASFCDRFPNSCPLWLKHLTPHPQAQGLPQDWGLFRHEQLARLCQ